MVFIEAALIFLSFVNVLAVEHQYCEDLQPQIDINIAQITGVWFGVEYIAHERSSMQYTYNSDYNYNSRNQNRRLDYLSDCFFVDIKELDPEPTTSSYYSYLPSTPTYKYGPRDAGVVPEQRYRHLVLQWDEPGNMLDYHVKFNMTRRGFWISTAPQNGARVADMYKHFAGTIQVLKAVSNHLVLSFCQRLPEQQIFTVILARQQWPRLDDGEIMSIHNMLSRKRLSTSNVKKVCNSAVVFGVALPSAILALFAYFLSHCA